MTLPIPENRTETGSKRTPKVHADLLLYFVVGVEWAVFRV